MDEKAHAAPDADEADGLALTATEDKPKRGRKAGVQKALGADLVPDLPTADGALQTARYWIGLLPSLGQAYTHLGGVTFHHVVRSLHSAGQLRLGLTPDEERQAMAGEVVTLSAAQIEKVKRAMRLKLVRGKVSVGAAPPGFDTQPEDKVRTVPRVYTLKHDPKNPGVLLLDGAPYRRQDGDHGIAPYVYMVKTETRGAVLPGSVYELGIEMP